MKRKRISRRTMLRGATGAAIALPMLDIMTATASTVSATPAAAPIRACYLYIPNGVSDNAWGAAKTGPDGKILQLNEWMSPLRDLQSQLIIPRRMWTPRGNGHGAGTATWLTGGGYDNQRIHAGGLSADQIVAQLTGDETLLPSLELSLRGEGYFSNSLVRNTISWSKNGPVPRDVEPRVVFDRMFRSGGRQSGERSVLDSVLEDARSMQRSGSIADQRKI
ncbi:MAG: DUF1552 domain-containing protein, partial [Planctomycetota bacterium]